MSESFKEFCSDLKNRIDIVDYIRGDTKLEQTGNDWRCLSPIRKERTPSFFIYPSTQSWFDWGVSEGGDVIDYVMKRDSCDFRAAIELLSKYASVEYRPSGEYDEEIAGLLESRYVFDILTEAASFYNRSMPRHIRTWVRDQYGFSDETIDKFKIGYADGNLWDYLTDQLGIDPKKVIKSGLFLKFSSGAKDFFDTRVTFPYFVGGKCRFMIARRTDETPDVEHEKSKYKKILSKSDKHKHVSKHLKNEWFFGEDSVRRHVDTLLITEGITDAISALEAGIPTISPVTTSFRKKDEGKLIEMSAHAGVVVIAMDSDNSGEKGADKLAKELFKAGRDIRLVQFKPKANGEKVDVASFIRDNGAEAFTQAVRKAKSLPEQLISKLERGSPAQISTQLKPIYEMVASCDATARDAYVGLISQRFGISKNVVRGEIKEHIHEEKIEEKEAEDDILRGQVFEDEGHFYYLRAKSMAEAISTFSLHPRERVVMETEETIVCDVTTIRGKEFERWAVPRSAWNSRAAFVRSLPIPDMQWTGNDDNVQGVLKLVSDAKIPTCYGTSVLGLYQRDGEKLWIYGNGKVLGEDGEVDNPSLRYVSNGSVMEHRLDYALYSREETKEIAEEVLPLLLQLNTPAVVLAMIGWFYACPFAPLIREELGHFPIMWVFGTQGSGKTTIVREVFWPLLGVSKERNPFSATDTEFSQVRNYSTTNAIPVCVDEYKPRDMGRGKDERLRRFARRLYGGEIETRGRADQQLNVYRLQAPLCVMGETLPEEPALIERMICVTPTKNSITAARKKTLDRLKKLPIEKLAGAFIQFSLTRNMEKDLEAAKKIVIDLLESGNHENVPPRPFDNLVVMVFGVMVFEAWAESLGVELPDIDLDSAFTTIVQTLLEGDGSQVKDAVDGFIESLSTYAHTGVLVENKHYTVIDDEGHRVFMASAKERAKNKRLAINLSACHSAYLEQRKREGQPDETNGIRALRRAFEEKQGREGSYVLKVDHRVTLGSSRPRCVVIDPNHVPEALDFTMFPAAAIRLGLGNKEDEDDDEDEELTPEESKQLGLRH